MQIDRRAFLSAGFAAGAATLLPRHLFAAPLLSTAPIPHMMQKTFAPLASSLLPIGAWKPYPKIEDRAGWNALSEDARASLVERADAALTGDWPQLTAALELKFQREGNRADFEAIFFARRVRLSDLVLGECVTAKGKYLDQIANGIWLISEESSWSSVAHLGAQVDGVGLANVTDPIIDLFAAETGAQLAWVHYLLESSLHTVSPELARRIQLEEKRRILDVFAVRDHANWEGLDGKPHRLNNWNPWINSNLLTATLLLEQDPARRAELVLKSCRSLDAYLEDVPPDGGCEEGPGYWSRSAASVMDCCDTLVSAHNGKGSDVLKSTYLRAAGRYIANVHIANRYYVDYGDAHMTDAPAPELVYRYGKATGDTVLQSFGAFSAANRSAALHDPRLRSAADSGSLGSLSRQLSALFVLAEMRSVPGEDALTRDAWYPDLGLMAARVKEGSPQGFYIALQAASNGRSHAHNDSGSFLLFADGEPVFIDVGVGQYTRQTFSADRYKIWTMQSAYHNLPTIGGVMQHEGNPYRAKVLDYQSTDSAAKIAVDLAPAYQAEAGVHSWQRTLTLDRAQNRAVLREEFQLAKAVPVQLSLMTMVAPQLVDKPTGTEIHVGNVALGFDEKHLGVRIEKVQIDDEHLAHSFPQGVFRILLSSANDVREGDWSFEMRQA